eukprot:m.205011 g.205011  ORF g.205011 m.205011 type:complete len:181 (-) comp13743_c0_seq3:941-1483(-)
MSTSSFVVSRPTDHRIAFRAVALSTPHASNTFDALSASPPLTMSNVWHAEPTETQNPFDLFKIAIAGKSVWEKNERLLLLSDFYDSTIQVQFYQNIEERNSMCLEGQTRCQQHRSQLFGLCQMFSAIAPINMISSPSCAMHRRRGSPLQVDRPVIYFSGTIFIIGNPPKSKQNFHSLTFI